MWAVFCYLFLIFNKTKIFFINFILVLIVAFLSKFLGNIASVEQLETSIIFTAGLNRYLLVLLMILLISFHITQMYENKQLDFLVSKAIKRYELVISYLLNIGVMSISFSLSNFITLMIIAHDINHAFIYHLNLACELFITGSFTLITGLIIRKHLIVALGGILFYLTSRLSGLWLMIAKQDVDGLKLEYLYKWLPQKIMMLLNFVLPRFDLITQSEWLITTSNNISFSYYIILEWIGLIMLLIAIGCYDLKKQEF